MDWQDGFTQGKHPRIVFETDEFPRKDRLRAYREANIKCKNYFAFMDEQDSLASNIFSVLWAILIYDFRGIPGHILWCLKHSGRILARVVESNK
jgi:hypothetical protein